MVAKDERLHISVPKAVTKHHHPDQGANSSPTPNPTFISSYPKPPPPSPRSQPPPALPSPSPTSLLSPVGSPTPKMLYFIGLGLADEKDISVKALEIVKRAERVYLEAYTAILLVDQERLESFYGRSIILADREMVESSSHTILSGATDSDIAFLVVGDPFGATTHTDLQLRCREEGVPTRTLPNASILTGIGVTGLSLYNFGATLSMVFFTESWRPASFYPKLAANAGLGLHTLVLLDIKVKEPDLDLMARTGRTVYLPPRYMTVAECAAQMVEVEEKEGQGVCGPDVLAVGVARVGSDECKIVAGTLGELCEQDLGPPLHSLVVVGKRGHDIEREFLREYAVDPERFDRIWKEGYGQQG
ncbi:diphthine synthase [Trichodelitschia bisporula]|uniref:Diphthine methyl ester synthase n=1 Tax=Trichodelitschia bisporula TaxID=703511 RepID=A0A6G1I325_9PEZI|nr:diphthine synthase [Trichodelitschia bisporula]